MAREQRVCLQLGAGFQAGWEERGFVGGPGRADSPKGIPHHRPSARRLGANGTHLRSDVMGLQLGKKEGKDGSAQEMGSPAVQRPLAPGNLMT